MSGGRGETDTSVEKKADADRLREKEGRAMVVAVVRLS
jgi:hypothetical protein